MGAGRLELLPGAPAGQHGDAGDPGRERSLDVVHVVADVDVAPVPPEHVALAGPPHPALDVVDVEPEVVDVQLGVGGVLAGDQHDPPVVASYGSQGVGPAGNAGVGTTAMSG